MGHEDLAVGYHQQDTNYYCGAACAQMVLHSVGEALLSQDSLYADNHNHSTTEGGWYTAPDGLQWTLNNRQSSKYFCLDALDSEDAISRMICWTIHHYRVAPVAMVFGSAHWIVVRGYTSSAVPASSVDTSYSISGFDVNNPWPPTPMPAPPPPHSDGDVCGGGGTRGVADEHISYSTWQSDYMTGVGFGHWNGKYIAICDPDPPPSIFGARPAAGRKRYFDGERLVPAGVAAEQVQERLKEEGLLDDRRWGPVFAGARPGEPVLVQRLDRADSFYWIVPMEGGQEGARAAVSVDARYGDYRQAIALRHSEAGLLGDFADAGRAEERLATVPVDLPERAGRLVLRREALCIYPTLVWRPCRESLSPFYPFRMVTVGGHQLFIRVVDGAVFSKLTLNQHGI